MTTPPSARKHDYSQTVYHQDSLIQDEINDRSPPAREHHWDDPSNVMLSDRGKRRERPPTLAIGSSLNDMDGLDARNHRDQGIERARESSTSSPSSASSAALNPHHFAVLIRKRSPGTLPSALKTLEADLFSNGTPSIHFGDVDTTRYHDHGEDDPNQQIPPIPLLPEDLSSYELPLPSSGSVDFPHSFRPEDPDRTVIIPSIDIPVSAPEQLYPENVPSKGWSFSPLGLKLPPGSGDAAATPHRDYGKKEPNQGITPVPRPPKERVLFKPHLPPPDSGDLFSSIRQTFRLSVDSLLTIRTTEMIRGSRAAYSMDFSDGMPDRNADTPDSASIATAPESPTYFANEADETALVGLEMDMRKQGLNDILRLLGLDSSNSSPAPTSSHQPISTPSPRPSTVDDEKLLGEEEMMPYVEQQQDLSGAGPSMLSSRFSPLPPSKAIKTLSHKMSLPAPRILPQSDTSPPLGASSPTDSSDRQSISTPSPVPSTVDDDELLGDEEMMQYIKRQHARKLANGARMEDLEEMLKFPEPLPPVPPSSPQAVLRSSQAVYLSDFERKEILDYPAVYYIGARSAKKQATRDNSTNNHGYDDERGDYQVVNRDHLAYRYEVIDTLGEGSSSQVLQCRDHLSGHSVAIKIICNKKRFHHQALVEIKILDNLRRWDPDEKHYVIKMTEHFYFRNHLCIAMELLSINLYELIKANGFVGFTTTLIRRFTSQMLSSLVLMRHHRIVHCDLKPENILLRHPTKSAIKIIDFGSSCFEHEKVYTYIQSRFYRSPEVILGMNYHMAIDMWSLGCILAQLYTGYPIFPGENEHEQLACIMEVLGVPDKELINRGSRKRLFFDATGGPRPVVNSKGRRRRPGSKTLEQVLCCDDGNFIDFIAKCLVWDPERRLKPGPALRHPFIVAGQRPRA